MKYNKQKEDAFFNTLLVARRMYKKYRSSFYKQKIIFCRNNIIEMNMGLVTLIAKRYSSKTNIPKHDLVQEGALGLAKAIDYFNPKKSINKKFSSYSAFWIEQFIRRYMQANIYSMKIPVHLQEYMHMVKNKNYKIEELNISETMAKNLRSIIDNTFTYGIEKRIHNDNDNKFEIRIADDKFKPSHKIVEDKMLKEKLINIMNDVLDEKERHIIMQRFGFDIVKKKTLQSIGDDYLLSRERIRQIETKAMIKLIRHKQIKSLRNYLHH